MNVNQTMENRIMLQMEREEKVYIFTQLHSNLYSQMPICDRIGKINVLVSTSVHLRLKAQRRAIVKHSSMLYRPTNHKAFTHTTVATQHV